MQIKIPFYQSGVFYIKVNAHYMDFTVTDWSVQQLFA